MLVRLGYDSASPSLHILGLQYHSSVEGLPLAAIVLGWLAGLAALGLTWRGDRRAARRLGWIPAGLLIAAVACLIRWASIPDEWRGAFDFRSYVFVASFPFVVMLAVDALVLDRRDRPAGASGRLSRWTLARLATAGFSLVLAVQSTSWDVVSRQLARDVAAAPGPCVAAPPLRGRGSAVDHWSEPSLVLLLQGREPTRAVLDADGCARLREQRVLTVTPWYRVPADGGWLHFGGLVSAVGGTS